MKVLIVRLSAMGDVVQSLAAVQGLLAARPDFDVHWVVQQEITPLFACVPQALQVVPHARGYGLRGYVATVRSLRRQRFDVALDLQGNWKSAGLARLSRARRVVGPPRGVRREPSSGWIVPGIPRETVDRLHPTAIAGAVVRAIAPDAVVRGPRLVAPTRAVESERDALRGLGVDPDRAFRVVVLGPSSDPRSLPESVVVREASRGDRPVVCVAGPAESAVRSPDGVPCRRHERGEIEQLVALGACVAAAGGEVVAADQGPAHVLAASGACVHVVSGPFDPARTAPPAATTWRAATPPACAPCHRRVCTHVDGAVCMAFDRLTAGSRAEGWLD